MLEQTEITPVLQRVHLKTSRDLQLRRLTSTANLQDIREKSRLQQHLPGEIPWEIYTGAEARLMADRQRAHILNENQPQAARSDILITPHQEALLVQSMSKMSESVLAFGVPYLEYDPGAKEEDNPDLIRRLENKRQVDTETKQYHIYATTDLYSSEGSDIQTIVDDKINRVSVLWNYWDIRSFDLTLDYDDGISYESRGKALSSLTDEEYLIVQHYLRIIIQTIAE